MPRPAARLLLALWTLVLVGAMLTPSERIPEPALLTYDKLIHMGAFALWTMLASHSVSLTRRRRSLWILTLGLGLAVGTEVAQATFKSLHRSGEVADAVADLLGIGLGLGVMAWFANRKRSPLASMDRAPVRSR